MLHFDEHENGILILIRCPNECAALTRQHLSFPAPFTTKLLSTASDMAFFTPILGYNNFFSYLCALYKQRHIK